MANLYYGAKGAKEKAPEKAISFAALAELKSQGDISAVHDLIGKFHCDAQIKQIKTNDKTIAGKNE